MVKPEPKLEDLDLEEGEKLLDWMKDDYAMHVIDDSRIYYKESNVILDYNVLLNDNRGQTKYFPSMADPGNEVIKISLPRTIKLCINTVAKYHTQRRVSILANTNQSSQIQTPELDAAKVMRILALHGMSIYEYRWGCEVDKITHDSMDEHMNCNATSVELFDMKNLASYTEKYSLRVSDKFNMYLNTWSEAIGVNPQLMCGFWMLLSLQTHNDLKNWNEVIDPNVNQVAKIIGLKLRILKAKEQFID
jgi:hypothetical protein